MPIIRQAGSAGGFFTGAGQAAGAFSEASNSAMRLLQRQAEVQNSQLLEMGRMAQNQVQETARFDQAERRLDLQERYENRQQELQDADFAGQGAQIMDAHRQLAALSPERAEAVHGQVAQILGSDFDGVGVTPEGLGRHPMRGAVGAVIMSELASAQQDAREADIQSTHGQALKSMQALDPTWLESPEGLSEVAALNAELLTAQSPRQAAQAAAAWRAEVGQRLRMKVKRETLFSKAEERIAGILKSDDARLGDEDAQARIQDAQLAILESDNPEVAFARFEMELDPFKKQAMEEARAEERMRVGRAMAAQAIARTEIKARMDIDGDGLIGGSQDAPVAAGAIAPSGAAAQAAAGPPTVEEFPAVASAAGATLMEDSRTEMIVERMRERFPDLESMSEEEQRAAFDAVAPEIREEFGPDDAMSRSVRDMDTLNQSTSTIQ